MDQVLYGLLSARSHFRCECNCGASVPPGEVDHFFGRAKSDEVEGTCWVLTPGCHFAKTRNSPSARYWLDRFIAHCVKWNYTESRVRAEARRDFVNARASSAVPP